MGLLDWMGEHVNQTVDAGHLSHDSKLGADLSPVLAVAQKLGLINLLNETVSMTDFGIKICEATNYREKARLLKSTLQTESRATPL